jgi:hypothetical protein
VRNMRNQKEPYITSLETIFPKTKYRLLHTARYRAVLPAKGQTSPMIPKKPVANHLVLDV